MKKLVFLLLISTFLISCVSKSKYEAMIAERDAFQFSKDSISKSVNVLNNDLIEKNNEIRKLQADLAEKNKLYNQLKNNSTAGALDMIKQLESLQKDIEDRENKLAQVKQKLEERENVINALRERVNQALLGFKDSGLTVSVKNGKVYVSLSNKLLFSTGSTEIDKKGKEALIELARVLNEQSDINVLVEGHTDNQAIRGGSRFVDNWDLSVLRATEVVRYITVDGNVDPKRVVASGRSEFFPLQVGDTPDARAANRRTEIILTPKLEELFDIVK